MLERLLADREFVDPVRGLARRSPLSMLAEPLAARQSLREAVASFLEAAEASGEIEPCDFKGLAGSLYTDYLAGVVSYWLADTSDEFADTTQLVDLSLGVLVQALRGGLVNRVLQLGGFVLRSQMARMVQHGSGLMSMLHMAQQAMASAPTARAPAPMAAAAASPATTRSQPPPSTAQAPRRHAPHRGTCRPAQSHAPQKKERPMNAPPALAAPTTARATQVPPGTAIHATLPRADFFDAYEVADRHPARSALQSWLDVRARTPAWTRALMFVRNKAVRLVGLKDLGQLDDGHPPASGRSLRDARSYRVGIFRIRHLSDTEVVMGQDDKHLDVQVSICKQPAAPGTAPRVVLSTVVHIHNTLGHAYMAVITPIHRVIARGKAQRLADHGPN